MTEGNGRSPERPLTREQLRALLDRRCTTEGAWRGTGEETDVQPVADGTVGFIARQAGVASTCARCELLAAAVEAQAVAVRGVGEVRLQLKSAEAARDALADEVAQLRDMLDHIFDVESSDTPPWLSADWRRGHLEGGRSTAEMLTKLGARLTGEAIAAEREACALVAERYLADGTSSVGIAAAIRARGEGAPPLDATDRAPWLSEEWRRGHDAGAAATHESHMKTAEREIPKLLTEARDTERRMLLWEFDEARLAATRKGFDTMWAVEFIRARGKTTSPPGQVGADTTAGASGEGDRLVAEAAQVDAHPTEPKPWRYVHGCQCPRCLEAKPGWDANGAPHDGSPGNRVKSGNGHG